MSDEKKESKDFVELMMAFIGLKCFTDTISVQFHYAYKKNKENKEFIKLIKSFNGVVETIENIACDTKSWKKLINRDGIVMIKGLIMSPRAAIVGCIFLLNCIEGSLQVPSFLTTIKKDGDSEDLNDVALLRKKVDDLAVALEPLKDFQNDSFNNVCHLLGRWNKGLDYEKLSDEQKTSLKENE